MRSHQHSDQTGPAAVRLAMATPAAAPQLGNLLPLLLLLVVVVVVVAGWSACFNSFLTINGKFSAMAGDTMLGNQKKRTKVVDIIEYTLKQKWKWAGHIARLKDNR